mgnify:CR=1 FL=1
MAETTAPDAPDAIAGLRARVEAAGGLTDWDMIALLREMVARRREDDLLMSRVAAAIGSRSPAGPGGMARRRGFTGVDQLIASETGGTVAEAERLRVLGTALFGEPDDAPGGCSVLPHLAFAARERRLSPDAFALIRDLLMKHPDARAAAGLDVAPELRATRLGRLPLGQVEKAAVDKAVGLPLTSVRSLVARLEADLTPRANAEDDYAEMRSRRWAVTREERDGMIKLTALLDPLTAAPLMAAMDGYVKKAQRARRDNGPGDDRTPDQMRADALSWLGRHATGCTASHDGIKTTISIRMTLADLTSGDGHGEVDGITAPVPAGELRRHAADAEIIPTVLGGRSEVLDHGRAERLFTRAQRRALSLRDGGCAWCDAPIAWTETHHIEHWASQGGCTDLCNGVLLCRSCHLRLHDTGWEVEIHQGTVWFRPPAAVDPEREAVLGGRRRTAPDAMPAPPPLPTAPTTRRCSGNHVRT